jgi:hypothetical protein
MMHSQIIRGFTTGTFDSYVAISLIDPAGVFARDRLTSTASISRLEKALVCDKDVASLPVMPFDDVNFAQPTCIATHNQLSCDPPLKAVETSRSLAIRVLSEIAWFEQLYDYEALL